MQSDKDNMEYFKERKAVRNLVHISELLPSINDFEGGIVEGMSGKSNGEIMIKPRHDFIDMSKKFCLNVMTNSTVQKSEISKNRSRYLLQELFYKNIN